MTTLFVPRSPYLKRKLLRLAERGAVVRLYPGIYCDPGLATSPEVRIHGSALWSGDGVLLGAAAARITFWPDIAVPVVSIGVSSDRVPPPGVRLHRGRIPPDLIMERQGLRCTVPALTALDLGGNGIDEALRRGAVTLDQLHQAIATSPHRYGNRERRLLLHESRDEPWSEAERLLHRLLRRAKITGWRTNVEVWCGSQQYFIDAAFGRLLLGIEVDGYAVHGQRGQFERDRQKWSDLTAAGWTLLHFTWHQLAERPDWVIETIQRTLPKATLTEIQRTRARTCRIAPNLRVCAGFRSAAGGVPIQRTRGRFERDRHGGAPPDSVIAESPLPRGGGAVSVAPWPPSERS